jgi:hypothetical protein
MALAGRLVRGLDVFARFGRIDARKTMVAGSIVRTRNTILNQVGNARISCRPARIAVNPE